MHGKRRVGICLCAVLGMSSPLHTNAADSSVSSDSRTRNEAPVYTYEIVGVYPHDPQAFTQGLVFEDGFVYEGTGLYGQSTLRKVNLATGKILRIRKLPNRLFGEGIAVFDNQIIQCTWQSHTAFVYDKHSFKLLKTVKYYGEGWGITHDGKRLFMSDGTSTLRVLDPESFEETDRIVVHDNNRPVAQLNELEYVQGEIYANVWKTNRIARISPDTGQVLGWIDLTGLLNTKNHNSSADVLNGIAYDAENDRLFITGKRWPKLFEIRLIPPS